VLLAIQRNPGLRSEQLDKHLRLDHKTAKAALAKLRALGKVKTTGQKRATTYAVA
jgi:hypothetical protein